jgi:hypothetical protein
MSKSRKSPRSNNGVWPKYYTNYAKDKRGTLRKMLAVVGEKESGFGGGAKKRVVDLSGDKSSADTSNTGGIRSKKVRGMAISKKGSSSSYSVTTRVGKDKMRKKQHKLERHLVYN